MSIFTSVSMESSIPFGTGVAFVRTF